MEQKLIFEGLQQFQVIKDLKGFRKVYELWFSLYSKDCNKSRLYRVLTDKFVARLNILKRAYWWLNVIKTFQKLDFNLIYYSSKIFKMKYIHNLYI